MPSYPQLVLPPGVTWNYKKTPKFSNISQTPQSAKHPATSTLQQGTIFEIELVFSYLKQNRRIISPWSVSNDLQYLQEFYEAVGGGFNWFVFDPSVSSFEDMSITSDFSKLKNGFIGIGDGVTTSFPLWRSTVALGGGQVNLLERIQNATSVTGIYVNNAEQLSSTYTINQFPATVVFNTPPPTGGVVSWGGTYAYLCQFAEDSIDFNEFMFQLWELQSLKLTTVNV